MDHNDRQLLLCASLGAYGIGMDGYKPSEYIGKFKKPKTVEVIVDEGKKTNAALIIEYEDVVVLSFRGTIPIDLNHLLPYFLSKIIKEFIGAYPDFLMLFTTLIALEPFLLKVNSESDSFQFAANDWLNDLQSRLSFDSDEEALKYKRQKFEGKTHDGFRNALNSIWPQILEKITPLLCPADIHSSDPNGSRLATKRLMITGHSKGGALSYLSAILLLQKFNWKDNAQQIDVVTFGTPRVGDKDFANSYSLHESTLCYDCIGDIVPHIPPEEFFIDLLMDIVDVFAKSTTLKDMPDSFLIKVREGIKKYASERAGYEPVGHQVLVYQGVSMERGATIENAWDLLNSAMSFIYPFTKFQYSAGFKSVGDRHRIEPDSQYWQAIFGTVSDAPPPGAPPPPADKQSIGGQNAVSGFDVMSSPLVPAPPVGSRRSRRRIFR
jgi:hypothetical protein